MILHPWHAISPGTQAPALVNSVIEITKGSKTKYELDKESGLLRLDRILRTYLTYPVHYGFIPQTYCEDQDPLDIIVICSEPLLPLTLVESRVIGALHMIDNGQQDDKIIGVAAHDDAVKHIQSLDTLPTDIAGSIKYFFENYKISEHKKVVINKFFTKQEAEILVTQALHYYQKNFKS